MFTKNSDFRRALFCFHGALVVHFMLTFKDKPRQSAIIEDQGKGPGHHP